jgi:hypothetical protein
MFATRHRLGSLFLLLSLGCSSQGSPSADGGVRPDGGSFPTTDGGTLDPDAGPAEDGGAPPLDGGDECSNAEAEIEATIGPAGGTLTLCGATVAIAAGSVERDTTFRFARATDAPRPVEPVVVDGYVYRLESEATSPVVTLTLPHSGDTEGIDLFEHTGAVWRALGLCDVSATLATQTFVGVGTFALLHDPRALPTSPIGLGTGTAEVTLGDDTTELSTGAMGFAASSALPWGAKLVSFQVYAADGSFLQVELLVGPDDAMEPFSIFHLDADAVLHDWTSAYAGAVPMDLTITPVGDALEGRLVGELRDESGGTLRFDATFDVTPGEWKEPPARGCTE